jgi:hypothetical protein
MAERSGAFDRGRDEPACDWLARLQRVDIFGLSMPQRMELSASRDDARKAAGERPDGESALADAKRAFLALSAEQGRQFVLWLSRLPPGGGGPQ